MGLFLGNINNLVWVTMTFCIKLNLILTIGLLWWLMVKNLPANAGDSGSIPREEHLDEEMTIQYPCLDNPKDRGAWRATVRGVTKSQT